MIPNKQKTYQFKILVRYAFLSPATGEKVQTEEFLFDVNDYEKALNKIQEVQGDYSFVRAELLTLESEAKNDAE